MLIVVSSVVAWHIDRVDFWRGDESCLGGSLIVVNLRFMKERSVAMSRNRTSTLTFVGSSDCDSPPRERGPVVERILAKKYRYAGMLFRLKIA